jgi:tRNA(fMet)-specific endonuclease VapC
VTVRYLLDSSIVSDLVRHPQGRTAARIAELGEDAVATSIIVAAELRYAAASSCSDRLLSQLETILGALEVLPIEAPVDASYASARAALKSGHDAIGANGLLLAAQAMALDMVVVTNNERGFARVGGLRVENWLKV